MSSFEATNLQLILKEYLISYILDNKAFEDAWKWL